MGNEDATNKAQIQQGGVKTRGGFSTFSSERAESDPQEYARLLEMYDTSFRNIAEGEVVKGTVVKVTPTDVIVDVGFKSEGLIAIDEFIDEGRPGDGAAGRHRRRAARAHRRPRRLRRALAREGREDEDLGRGREGLPGTEGGHRPRHRADQGRSGGRHRRARVPARLADRRASGAQPRRAARAGTAHAGHQGQQEARQHRALAQGRARRRERREEEGNARDARRGQGAARHGQEPHRLRRVHRPRRHRRSAAHHRHVVGPGHAPVRGGPGRRRDRRHRAQVRSRARARVARPQAAACRSVEQRRSSATRSASA